MVNNITTKVNNIEEACCNEFSRINVIIEDLQNKINQHYAVVQRSDLDQQSEFEVNSANESETNSRGSQVNSSSSSSGSSGSSQKFANIISVIREQFTVIFDRIKGANDYSLDQMCAIVSADILSRLGMGVIGKDTIKGFYRGENLNSKNLEKIGAWIDNTHLHRY
ncbi:unnamed protein product [Rhizophagus irregularis]|nr:unnamed protein product [Rhizophagus irregularis]